MVGSFHNYNHKTPISPLYLFEVAWELCGRLPTYKLLSYEGPLLLVHTQRWPRGSFLVTGGRRSINGFKSILPARARKLAKARLRSFIPELRLCHLQGQEQIRTRLLSTHIYIFLAERCDRLHGEDVRFVMKTADLCSPVIMRSLTRLLPSGGDENFLYRYWATSAPNSKWFRFKAWAKATFPDTERNSTLGKQGS